MSLPKIILISCLQITLGQSSLFYTHKQADTLKQSVRPTMTKQMFNNHYLTYQSVIVKVLWWHQSPLALVEGSAPRSLCLRAAPYLCATKPKQTQRLTALFIIDIKLRPYQDKIVSGTIFFSTLGVASPLRASGRQVSYTWKTVVI